MKSKVIVFGFLIAGLLVTVQFAGAQNPNDEEVRGAFLTSRPKAAERPAKTSTSTTTHVSHRRPRPAPDKKPDEKKPPVDSGTKPDDKPRHTVDQRLGLGVTLFMRDANGMSVRVDPNRDFQKGDRVRVLLETNVNGHLYIFNTTNDGSPVMIYPNPQLDEGGNYVQAHVPFEIPSSLADEERLRWFTFDEQAGTERLYFVFTREPLNNVPIEDELLKFCGEKKAECAWHPEADLWTSLQKEMAGMSRSENAKGNGKEQTAPEREATARGIGLAKEDPEPSMVIMNASSGPNLLVAAIALSHK